MAELTANIKAAKERVKKERPVRWTYAALVGAFFVGIPVAGLLPDSMRTRLVLTAIIVTAFLLVAAKLQTGTVLGVLLDDRKKASSSRLQLLAWTILILSGFSSAALWNVTLGANDPLGIAIPEQIWAALGISFASFAGSPLLKARKEGELTTNTTLRNARLTDVVMSEEKTNKGTLDVGKAQMLLFTLIILIAYGAALFTLLSDQASRGLRISEFPSIDGGMLALLGISHSGYLVNKAT